MDILGGWGREWGGKENKGLLILSEDIKFKRRGVGWTIDNGFKGWYRVKLL